VVEAEEEE